MGVSGIVTLLILIFWDVSTFQDPLPKFESFPQILTQRDHDSSWHPSWNIVALCLIYRFYRYLLEWTATNLHDMFHKWTSTCQFWNGVNRTHSRWVQLPFEDVVQRSGQRIIASAYIRGLVPHTQQRPVSWRCGLVVVINGGYICVPCGVGNQDDLLDNLDHPFWLSLSW